MAEEASSFIFGEQLVLAGVSILQDSFAKPPFAKGDFSYKPTATDPSSTTDEDDTLLIWRNNSENVEGLVITEKEPFEMQRFPTIAVSISNNDMKNLDFGQFIRPYIRDGRRVGDVLGGGGEFDLVFRCMAETTDMRKKLTDRVMAILLINRTKFLDYGIALQTIRFGGYGSIPYLNNDKSIYYSDVVGHCWGEWEFPFDRNLSLLKQISLAFQIIRGQVQSPVSFLWNVE